MEKLKFTLKSEDETIINREESYYIKDNVIKFKIDIAMFIFWMYNCKCEQILIKEMRS